jgi:GGDEF domain-containing protein
MPPATAFRRRAANRIWAVLRDPDGLGRFDGDEFVIVMAEQRSAGGDLSARMSSRHLADAALCPAKRARRTASRT